MKLLLLLCIVCLCGCQKEDIKKGIGTYYTDKEEIVTVQVTIKNGRIFDVYFDETANGKEQTKKELKDHYHLKVASKIGREWNEQVQYLEDYIKKYGIEKIRLNTDGKAENADVVSGCTIRIDGFLKALNEAIQNAEET